jgi:hypothetical protein
MHPTTDTLIDYLHRELPPEQDASVLAHVSACQACAAALEAEAAFTECLRSAARAEEREFPAALRTSILDAALRREPTWPERLRAFARPVILAPLAVGVAAAVLGLVPLSRHPAALGPSLPVQYYLDEHAASAGQNPLADRSATTMLVETSYRTSAGSAPAAMIEAAGTTWGNGGP